jgi:hypothetical protein
MAVEDKYVNTTVAAGKLERAGLVSGAKTVTMVATEEVAAADDDGSTYRLFKSVPSTYIPVQIDVMTDGITAGTDYELGLYKVGVGGAVVELDCLMGTQTMASALTRASGQGLGLAGVNIADIGKTLGELSGQTTVDPAYDIVLTANTVGTAAGTISIIATFIEG